MTIAIFQMSNRNKVSANNVLSEVEGASEVVSSARQRKQAARVEAKKAAKAAAKVAPKTKAQATKKGAK